MSIRTSISILSLLASCVVAAPVLASDASTARESQDRAAIEKLLWDYARALDSGNAEGYAALYTPDGAFGNTKGHEALKKMISDLNTSRAARKAKGEVVFGTLHMTTDHYVEFTDKDHATIRYYWLTSFVAPEGVASSAPAAQRIPFTGHGIDTLVRVDGKWLIKYRDVNAKD